MNAHWVEHYCVVTQAVITAHQLTNQNRGEGRIWKLMNLIDKLMFNNDDGGI